LKWDSKLEVLESGRVRRFVICHDINPLSYSDVIHSWQSDAGFRTYFTSLLANAPFEAFLWEVRAVTTQTLDREFEFVIVDCAALYGVQADPVPFGKHIESGTHGDTAVVFPNLAGDALLIAPCAGEPRSAYPHMAAFVRNATERQQHALWERVGAALERRIGEKPTWLSTSGLGVYWLHVRLDSYPKYYSYRPYRASL
jgi:hypothetical protein